MKDNRTLEQKIRAMYTEESDLYYGSDKARDTYAKDTPGQTPGVEHNPDFQKHDTQLAVDGVPEKGGMIKKPVVSKAIKKDASPVKFKSVIAEFSSQINEAEFKKMSPAERKVAAKKIFQMRKDSEAQKALQQKGSAAAKAAKRDSRSYKTSDDSHLDSKPSSEPKRGRGEKDLPHIVSQLRGVVDTKDGKPSSVKFKDGTTKNVKPKHAASWLKKHDSAKPAEKMSMYKSHDNKKTFKQYAKEDFVVEKHMSEKGPNCGCGKDPCETYGKDPLMPKGDNAKNMNEMKSCPDGQYYCMSDEKCKPIPEGMTTDKDGMLVKEAVRAYDRSSKGRAYRRLSDEEKKRLAKKNELMRAARRMRGQAADDYASSGKMRKPTIGGAKSVYKGRKMSREQVEALLNHLSEQEKMVGSEYQGRMKKHGKMSDAQKKAVTSVYDKTPVDKKMAGDPQVKRAQRYMKIGEALNKFNEYNDMHHGEDPSDATPKAELENERSKRLRKMMQKPNKPKPMNELSSDLIKKVAKQRRINTHMAYTKHDDHRDPDYKKAAEKQKRNQKLTFSAGARKIGQFQKSLSKSLNKEETVNEISKDLAGRYIKRAVGDAISKADQTQFHTSKMFQKQDAGDKKGAKKHAKAADEPRRKTMNRFYGIQRAASKMNKNDKNSGEYLAHSMTKQKTSGKVKATEAVDSKDKKGLNKLVKGLKGSSAAHLDQMKKLKKMISDSYIAEKSEPNNPKLWAAKKAQAKAKFDVYPSAYANGWAAKQYKAAGGTWRSAK